LTKRTQFLGFRFEFNHLACGKMLAGLDGRNGWRLEPVSFGLFQDWHGRAAVWAASSPSIPHIARPLGAGAGLDKLSAFGSMKNKDLILRTGVAEDPGFVVDAR
jgi:hypothetical protein